MKNFFFIFIFFSICLNVYSQKIATFKFSYILDNLQIYNNFIKQIDNFKKKKFEELKIEENILTNKKKEIEDSRILLSESEYLRIISEFNDNKKLFENKVNKLNNYLQENIELNENLILKEIVDIVRNIAIENNIDIILFEEQYFLASDSIDISEQTPETEVINETKEVDTEAKIEEKKDISEKKSKVSKEELKTEKK